MFYLNRFVRTILIDPFSLWLACRKLKVLNIYVEQFSCEKCLNLVKIIGLI